MFGVILRQWLGVLQWSFDAIDQMMRSSPDWHHYGGDGQTTFALPNLQPRSVHVGPGLRGPEAAEWRGNAHHQPDSGPQPRTQWQFRTGNL